MSLKSVFDSNNVEILVFQGSWCPMCVSAMPQIAKFVADNELNEEKIEVITVNPSKTEPVDSINKYKITRVPTIVFLKDGQEHSRITEYAPNGWKSELESKLVSIKE